MRRFTLFTLLLILTNTAFSQQPSDNLRERWDGVMSKAESYQHYKVVKKTDLIDLWRNINDTLFQKRGEIVQNKSTIVNQEAEISALKKEIVNQKAKYEALSEEKDAINFLGANINKYSYTTTLWVIISLIGLACLVLFYLFASSNKVTRQKIGEYEELFERFEDHKKNTLEKERKLKRELQTQMNLVEELRTKRTKV